MSERKGMRGQGGAPAPGSIIGCLDPAGTDQYLAGGRIVTAKEDR
jgi:hypothetical protein